MLRRLYDWILTLAAGPHAGKALAAVSFSESSFFPIIPDVMLVPMALARPEKSWRYALICTLASVLGGLFGYAIGALLYDSVGAWVIKFYGLGGKFEDFRQMYQQHGHWVILIKGLLPIPYKLVTIASGVAGYDIPMFILLSLITRGGRFFLLAGLVKRFGPPIRGFIEKRLALVMAVVGISIIGGFFAIKLFF